METKTNLDKSTFPELNDNGLRDKIFKVTKAILKKVEEDYFSGYRVSNNEQNFFEKSNSKAQKVRTTEDAVKQTSNTNAKSYLTSKNHLFKRDYPKWSKWMIKNKLFQYSPSKKHPQFTLCTYLYPKLPLSLAI
ncbi:hypothetical protein [Proteus mirabilis]|uniref:hypothetical protein n=1 Tax=Proteus mirabilis TaxID=584 RepID=UPI0023F82428|nr:hypothetical protein [Proteus mirabilis]MDF7351282.1 hypothetical protein [Proteus mirabilis]